MSPVGLGALNGLAPLGTCRSSPPEAALRVSGGAGPPEWAPLGPAGLHGAAGSPGCLCAKCGTFGPGLSGQIGAWQGPNCTAWGMRGTEGALQWPRTAAPLGRCLASGN